MGMCDAIVDAARRRAKGRPVSGVKVRVGGHPVDPEVIDQGFRLAAEGTEIEGARIDLVMEPLSVHCGDCGGTTPVGSAAALAACPVCGGVDVRTAGRDDVVLESITVAAGPDGAADGSPDGAAEGAADGGRERGSA
ncbi:hydrogenase maturation nickel metallochaperone HypA [Actinomadura sp. LOL_016]|uniref:hydrogenase maturation nickel metallochaperone HypA n=1 Tax=unclassified Actinomadura TaxID=2626254 RepID=UPI003A805716